MSRATCFHTHIAYKVGTQGISSPHYASLHIRQGSIVKLLQFSFWVKLSGKTPQRTQSLTNYASENHFIMVVLIWKPLELLLCGSDSSYSLQHAHHILGTASPSVFTQVYCQYQIADTLGQSSTATTPPQILWIQGWALASAWVVCYL